MLHQSTKTILPLLPMLQQPAFCLLADGSIECNHSAAHLAPARKESLPLWLGEAGALYSQWSRETVLELPVRLIGRDVTVTVQALEDGELFLISDRDLALAVSGDALAVASQVLRLHLGSMMSHTTALAEAADNRCDPVLADMTSGLTKDLLRMMRLSSNLADMDLLRRECYPTRLELLCIPGDLQTLLTELEDVFAAAGRSLHWQMPQNTVQIYGDRPLLERALLNLLSNALKFGTKQEPVSFRVDVQTNAVLFRIRNSCRPEDVQLLTSAFQRLETRGTVPDPRWGIGLGLPLVQRIAAIHGGAVALESRNGSVTVTMSVSRRKPIATEVRSVIPIDYTGGIRRSILELSDVLPDSLFQSELF